MDTWLSDLESDNPVLVRATKQLSELLKVPVTVRVCDEPYEESTKVVEFRGDAYGGLIHRFSLSPFPSCCGILISHNSYTFQYGGKGIYSCLSKIKQELAADLDYSTLICADVATNKPTNKVLTRDGWEKVFSFNNKFRTQNEVNIYAVDVGDWKEAEEEEDYHDYSEDDEGCDCEDCQEARRGRC